MDGKYNGWANYETWLAKLWIDNDQGSQEYWAETTRMCDDARELARELERQCQNFPMRSIGILLLSAFRSVDWYEIALALKEAEKEE